MGAWWRDGSSSVDDRRPAQLSGVLMRAPLLLLVLVLTAAPVLAADSVRTEAAGLRFNVPAAWTRVPAASDMRAAQFRIPRSGETGDDGELVLFHFGAGKGGGTQENVDRWLGQLTQPDGKPTKDVAVTTIRTVNGLKETIVDAPGTYAGMGGHGETPKTGWRLLGAVVEGPGGPWFWKAVGPDATIGGAKPGFEALLSSVEAHK